MRAAVAQLSTAPRLTLGRVGVSLRAGAARAFIPPNHWDERAFADSDFAAALEDVLGPVLASGDPSVWIIRRVNLKAVVDAGWDRAQTARAFASALRGAVMRALKGESVDGVIRFADRSAYLARFLADLADGEAFDRWFHGRFADLRPIPRPQALRMALERQPDDALAALAELDTAGRLPRVLECLGESESARVFTLLAAQPSSPAERHAAAAALARWANGGGLVGLAGAGHRLRLAGLVRASCALSLRPAALAPAVDRWAQGEPATTTARRAANGAAAPEEGAANDSDDPARADKLQRTLSPRMANAQVRQAPHAAAAADAPVIETTFPGVFLLWRSVAELKLETLLPPTAEARLILAATLAGPTWRAALEDPGLRWLSNYMEPDPPAIEPPPAGTAARFAAHMSDYFAPRPLRPVEQRHGSIRIVQDLPSQDWLMIGERMPAEPADDGALRPLALDLAHFDLDPERPEDPRLIWVLIGRAAYGDLGRRLTGLAGSSAAYLARNLLEGRGSLTLGPEPEMSLPRAPLDLVLRMSAVDAARVPLADGRAYRLRLPR